MKNDFENINEMIDVITDELTECELDDNFQCSDCCDLEQCYFKATTKANHEFAESLDYGGYDSEEEFWENLD